MHLHSVKYRTLITSTGALDNDAVLQYVIHMSLQDQTKEHTATNTPPPPRHTNNFYMAQQPPETLQSQLDSHGPPEQAVDPDRPRGGRGFQLGQRFAEAAAAAFGD